MKALVEAEPNLDLLQGNVLRILEEGGEVKGIETTLGLQVDGGIGDYHDREPLCRACCMWDSGIRPGAGWGTACRL